MALILPEVHASGLWKLNSPFNNYLSENKWYTCIAVRKIEDYIILGIDPFKEFYEKPFKLNKDKYETDVKAGVCIVTVKDSSGAVKSFPSSYIASFPLLGGVSYQVLAMAATLGAVPESLDLEVLKQRIKEVIRDTIGIDSEIKIVNLAPKELIERDSHERIEAARKAKIASSRSAYTKNAILEKENAALKKQLEDSNKWILAEVAKQNAANNS